MGKEAQIILSDESFVGVMSIMFYYIQQLIINIITSATNASDIILPKLHLYKFHIHLMIMCST